MGSIRKYLGPMAVAFVTAAVMAGGPVLADGVRHALFAHNAGKLDGLDSTAFVRNRGVISVPVFGPWISGDPTLVSVEPAFATTTFRSSGPGQRYVALFPSLPSSLYGKSVSLTGVEICYDTSNANVNILTIELTRQSSTGPGSYGGSIVLREDLTAADDGAFCKKYTGTALRMGINSFADLKVLVNWTGADSFYIQRTTIFLRPTAKPAVRM
jgi:hypothetical protein